MYCLKLKFIPLQNGLIDYDNETLQVVPIWGQKDKFCINFHFLILKTRVLFFYN